MLEALEDLDLLPTCVSGSSAGALAGACWASGCTVSKLKTRLFGLTKADFWDPSLGPGLLKGLRFRQILAEICPVPKIENCSVPLVISAFDLISLSTHSLRDGNLCNAVYASCCVPFLFQPIRIGQSLYFDGGIGDRPGLAGIPASSRVLYHHLQSGRPTLKKNQGLFKILEKRPNTVAILVNNLEPVSPARMSRGQQVFHQTSRAIRKALEHPISNRTIVI